MDCEPHGREKIKVAGCSLTIEQAAITQKLNINIPFNAMNGWNRFVIQVESFTPEFDGDRQLGIFIEDVRIEPPHVGKLWEKLTAILVAWSLSRPR